MEAKEEEEDANLNGSVGIFPAEPDLGAIGSTTSTVAVSEQVKLFKQRNLQRESSKGEQGRDGGMRHRRNSVEPLSSLCVKSLAKNFEKHPFSEGILTNKLAEFSRQLDLDMDIATASAYIYDENYWKKRSERMNWMNCQISDHGMTWKQLYFEKSLQEYLEGYKIEDDFGEIAKLITASQDYVFRLSIKQLLSHIDLRVLFDNLPNLARLELTYGARHIGMKYDRSLFGMKIADATSLAAGLRSTAVLSSLSLQCNLVDDDLLRMLMTGLITNNTITELDVSHNKITNHGARLLAKLLGPKSVLTSLDLCDNQIHAEGGRYLGRALKRNESLTELNMRLNRLTDQGGSMVFDGLCYNQTLTSLNLGSNSISTQSMKSLCKALLKNRMIVSTLDLSCNELDDSDLEELYGALQGNETLMSLDIRKNHFPPESVFPTKLAQIMKTNELRNKSKSIQV